MSLQEILRRYDASEYTVTDTMLAVLQVVSRENVESVLASLPEEVRDALRQFVGYYRPEVRIINGPIPSEQAVQLVREFFANAS